MLKPHCTNKFTSAHFHSSSPMFSCTSLSGPLAAVSQVGLVHVEVVNKGVAPHPLGCFFVAVQALLVINNDSGTFV